MKFIRILLIALILVMPSCGTFKKGAEEEVREEVIVVMDKKFDDYADRYHERRRKKYMEKVSWTIATVGGTLGVLATGGGLVLLYRKIKRKNGNV